MGVGDIFILANLHLKCFWFQFLLRTIADIYTQRHVTVVSSHVGQSNGQNPTCPSHACHVFFSVWVMKKFNVSVITRYYSGACESPFSRVTKVRYDLHFSDQSEI